MSVLERMIAMLFQQEVFEVLVSGVVLLFLYLFASEFFLNRNERRKKRF